MLSLIRPLSDAGLRQFISKALDRGWVKESFHSEVDRAYRNISDEDVQYGLSRADWVIVGDPEQTKKGFKYLVRTVDIEQEELHLVVSPTDDETLIIVTKY